jgi:hypothetical protein
MALGEKLNGRNISLLLYFANISGAILSRISINNHIFFRWGRKSQGTLGAAAECRKGILPV